MQNECDFDGHRRTTVLAQLPIEDGGLCTQLFSFRQTARHICCLLEAMVLQSKARGQ